MNTNALPNNVSPVCHQPEPQPHCLLIWLLEFLTISFSEMLFQALPGSGKLLQTGPKAPQKNLIFKM